VSDEHQIPWGMPGPTDRVERAWATGIERAGDHYTIAKPVDWSNEGVPDELRDPEDPAMTPLPSGLLRQPHGFEGLAAAAFRRAERLGER
jgi:hypothetical protein